MTGRQRLQRSWRILFWSAISKKAGAFYSEPQLANKQDEVLTDLCVGIFDNKK